jgi:hypothetical protein
MAYIYRGTVRETPEEPAPKVKRGPGRPPNAYPSPCGTPSAYARHKRLGEPVDLACRLANSAACKARRDKTRKPARPLTPCGTRSAYVRHRRRGEPIDDVCRLAHNARNRAWKAKKAAE